MSETHIRSFLIVEDNWNDLVLMTHVLDELKMRGRAFAVHNGAQLLEFLLGIENGKNPVPIAVFLDIGLPDIPGDALIKEIRGRERCKKLPIIIFSDHPVEHSKELGRGWNIQGYYQKPSQFGAFQQLFSELLMKWVSDVAGANLESA